MNNQTVLKSRSERGGAQVKLIIFIAVVAIAAYAAYMYIPVAVDAYYFKDAMQNKVNLAAAQGYDTAWLADQVSKSRGEFHVPDDAVITPSQNEGACAVPRPIQSSHLLSRLHLQLRLRLHSPEHQFPDRQIARMQNG
jgi:hypothetical protein